MKKKRLDEIKRLKRVLESQQRGVRNLRQTYSAELYGRSELQKLLKQCLLDIRQEVKNKQNPRFALDSKVRKLSTGRGTSEDKPLDLLQSQDRVISMLYHRAFPITTRSELPQEAELEELNITEDDLSELFGNRPHTSNEAASVSASLDGGGSSSAAQNSVARPSTTVQ